MQKADKICSCRLFIVGRWLSPATYVGTGLPDGPLSQVSHLCHKCTGRARTLCNNNLTVYILQHIIRTINGKVIFVTENSVWVKAQTLKLKVSDDILPGFDIGFDKRISKDVEKELRSFVNWIESNYHIPITLWVDFEYNHYLISRNGKRVGYLFYWADFPAYPAFDNKEDIPQIRLPVRTEYSTIEEILTSFIEAITDYYAWLCNEIYEGYTQNENDVEEILQAYLRSRR